MKTIWLDRPTEADGGAALRWPALWWLALHVPVVLALFGGAFAQALRGVSDGYRAPLWPAFAIQALTLTVAVWLVTLPLSLVPRLYRFALPLLAGLLTVVLALDARVYASVGFHINGFFFRVAVQPGALRETGVPLSDVLWFTAQGVGVVLLDTLVGAWFLRTFAARERRRTWAWALALVLLGGLERTYSASMAFFGGPGVFAAGQVLPLQAPVRMGKFWEKLTGRQILGSPLKGVSGESALRLPPGVDPALVAFERKPDVVFVLLESARADYLSPEVMPRLFARAENGAVFEHHYALAPTTYFTVFGLLFGLEAHKLDAVVGAGRRPLVFRAFQRNGYASKFLAASSVDWMGLREQVFGDVAQSLETDWPAGLNPEQKDAAMLAEARRFVAATPADQPVFLFLFFVGTHFNYTYPERSARFAPAWDGEGILKASTVPGDLILARARNSAYEADWKVDEFLAWFEQQRGRRPLALVTGDHGEEMREQGHVGHGSALTVQQLHVPMVVLGDGVPAGRRQVPTSHADVVPTLLDLLGDKHDPALYSDGVSMFQARPDRFVLTTVGWEPKFAAIGKDLKVAFNGMDVGLGGVTITDPDDKPLADGEARFGAAAPRILELFRRPPLQAAQAPAPPAPQAVPPQAVSPPAGPDAAPGGAAPVEPPKPSGAAPP